MRPGNLVDEGNAREWRRLFRLWFRRVLARGGWRLCIVASPHLDALAEYSTVIPRRELVFTFRPDAKASSETVAHEVGHVLVAPMQHWADQIIGELPESQRSLARKAITDAMEEAAEMIGLALVDAYRAEDGGLSRASVSHCGRPGGKRNVKAGRQVRK